MEFGDFVLKFIFKNKWKRIAVYAEKVEGYPEIAEYIRNNSNSFGIKVVSDPEY